jgi:hypothetical protein
VEKANGDAGGARPCRRARECTRPGSCHGTMSAGRGGNLARRIHHPAASSQHPAASSQQPAVRGDAHVQRKTGRSLVPRHAGRCLPLTGPLGRNVPVSGPHLTAEHPWTPSCLGQLFCLHPAFLPPDPSSVVSRQTSLVVALRGHNDLETSWASRLFTVRRQPSMPTQGAWDAPFRFSAYGLRRCPRLPRRV